MAQSGQFQLDQMSELCAASLRETGNEGLRKDKLIEVASEPVQTPQVWEFYPQITGQIQVIIL